MQDGYEYSADAAKSLPHPARRLGRPVKSLSSWDDALPAFAHAMAEATVPERTRMWNTLQRVASARVPGADKLSRLPWPQAWLHLTPDDLLEVLTVPTEGR